MILGHAALAVLARKTAFRSASLPVLLAATFGPDLIDKAAMLACGTPSKWFGHSLAGFLVVFLVMSRCPAWRRQPVPVWWGAALLWLSHLTLDLTGPTILFWPLLGPFPPTAPYDLSEGFIAFYTGRGDGLVLTFDLLCLAAAGIVLLRHGRRRATRA